MSPRLVSLTGPLSGRTFLLGETLSIGRHSSNDLQLRDPAASRRHCVLEPGPAGPRLRDLASSRGTFVNGVPVQERTLDDGDLVTIGSSLFLFESGETRAGDPSSVLVADGDGNPATSATTVELSPRDALYAQPSEAVAARAAADPGGRIARDLHTLLQIASALPSERSTEALARRLLGLVLEAVPGDRTALLFADRGTDDLADVFALARTGSAEPFPVSRTLARRVLDDRVAVLARDVVHHPALAAAESLRAERIRSLIAVPLLHLDRALGLLYADARDSGADFDEGHLELLTAVAGIAAASLAQVRQLEWLEEEGRRLAHAASLGLLGESLRMRELHRLLTRVAATDSTVLLRGESGTGKELAARAIYQASPRAERPFVAVNCAALSETLLESELFGHERGAFTGAVTRKIGKVELADTGTLFLDELGEIPPPLQARLLRFLQEREIERLGGTRPIPVDVRVIAATNRDLEQALREGTFREDLYYRLKVISLHLPALRERREDIPLLASHFAAQTSRHLGRPVAGFTAEARACLQRYDWPGNVRELANAVERAVVLSEGDILRPEDLPEEVVEAGSDLDDASSRYHKVLGETKRRLILDAVRESGGSITRAAALLGLHPNYLHRLIRNLDLRAEVKG